MGLLDWAASPEAMGLAQGLLSGNFAQGVANYSQIAERENAKRQALKDQQMQADEFAQFSQGLLADPQSAAAFALKSRNPQLQKFGMEQMMSQAKSAAEAQDKAKVREILGSAKNAQEAILMGADPKLVQDYYNAGDLGKRKVAQWLESEGANGQKIRLPVDEFGQALGQGVTAYTAPVQVDLGGKVAFVKPQAGVDLGKTMSPGERDASARGWANVGLSRDRLAFDKAGGASGAKPEKETPVQTRVREANDALQTIAQAEKLLDKSTGSYLGSAIDQGARVFGASTEGANAAAQLKALEGDLVSKMPKMSGPQSDKDVLLYKQMAGQIGDPTLPAATKKAALQAIKTLQARYASQGDALPTQRQSAPPAPMKGMVKDGYRFKGGDPANPSSWEKI